MIDLFGYSNVALQFSGGKDSLACLYLLKDQLEKVVVYYLDTGDGCPETHAVIDKVKGWIPRFITIKSDVKKWRELHGYPSDLVPARSHEIGLHFGMSAMKVSNRFDCCYYNVMLPLHNRMIEDKVDLVIRGTKLSDTGRLPADGKTEFYTIFLPIKEWSHNDVFKYLKETNAPYNPIYDTFKSISAPECLGCTAWWDDGKAGYLKKYHPKQYYIYRNILFNIYKEIAISEKDLQAELST
jgi:phosphoadenosine phosphosulfate reductase